MEARYMMIRWIMVALLSSTVTLKVFTQSTVIQLNNPSFEGIPKQGAPPSGWRDCGFAMESPPDVQPSGLESVEGFFNVTTPAQQGATYLGMVVRDNDTYERISQPLSKPLKGGDCYEFSLYLCRSLVYTSLSRETNEPANYATPAKLRIWGGSDGCNREELLAESGLVKNSRWLVYTFRFEPKRNISNIILEAFYQTPTPFPYNGNILVDNCSPIVQVPCVEEVIEPIALVPSREPKKDTSRTPSTKSNPEDTNNTPTLAGVSRKELAAGKTVKLDQLRFEADSTRIIPENYATLNDIYDFLAANTDVSIEIGGHTNNLPPHEFCDRLSSERAKSVAEYLNRKGIPWSRLSYKGYGKRQPIADNKSLAGRKANQRVEIKVTEIGEGKGK